VAKIYRNEGGAFFEIPGALPEFLGGAVAFEDYDNDGDLDILAGRVYRNDNGTFVLTSIVAGKSVKGDYDNDGDLDILETNLGSRTNPFTRLLRNNSATANTSPTVSTGLAATVIGNSVALSWGQATDGQTPANALSYNLRVGKTPGGSEIVSAEAIGATGYRQTPQLGNANLNRRWTIKNLPAGIYYWSVQAVDPGFMGSAFAAEQSFAVTMPISAPQNLLAAAEQAQIKLAWAANTESNLLRYRIYRSIAPPANVMIDSMAAGVTTYTDSNVTGGTTYFYRITAVNQALQESPFSNEVSAQLTMAAFADLTLALTGDISAWGDYDNDGDLDILTQAKVYRNDPAPGRDAFVDIGATLTGEKAAWSDYDNDGDLDILSGVKLFRNDSGSFVATNITFGNLSAGAGYWGDYDNDGDLDILFVGAGTSFIAKIFRNDPAGSDRNFVDIATPLNEISAGAAAWGDYDNDGDLDILLTGICHSGRIAKIYRNEAGTFVEILAPLIGVSTSSAAWGDYDSDGDLDIVLMGNYSDDLPPRNISRVYRNDNGSFVAVRDLDAVNRGSVVWGDYDNDGDLDILLAGERYSNFSSTSLTTVYRNENGRFVDIAAGLRGVTNSAVAWGDYDNDGDLDILLSGREWLRDSFNGISFLGGFIATVYRSNLGAKNTAPAAPANLIATFAGNSAALSWSQSNDNQTAPNGLTYNLRLGTTPRGVDKASPMANVNTGYRRVAQLGNTNHNTRWTIKNLPKGKYYWSAQAIDNVFAGSEFAPEQTFVLGDTVWPGDTNNNRLVNQADVLPIGLYFNKTGPKRDNASSLWKGQVAESWSPAAATHADANGDGIVNQADILPIGLNWGRTHTSPALIVSETDNANVLSKTATANLSTAITGDTNPNQDFWIDVKVDQVANLFGIAFELLYAPTTLVDPLTTEAGAFLGNDVIFFPNIDKRNGKISIGISRKVPHRVARRLRQSGMSGSGVVARIKMHVSNQAQVGQTVSLNLQNATALDSLGQAIQVNVTNKDLVLEVASRPNDLVPTTFALYPNVPNPFNPSTLIKYNLAAPAEVSIEIFDMLGRRVRTLVKTRQPAGRYAMVWDGRNEHGQIVASGVFIYQLRAGNPSAGSGQGFVQSRKMLLVR